MSKHPYYLGISIGPIYDTLSRARKTRELWAGSYLFSRLMKALLQAVAEEGADAGCQVLSPVPVTDPEQPIFGAGIYPVNACSSPLRLPAPTTGRNPLTSSGGSEISTMTLTTMKTRPT